jgi:hypothetical protein
MFIKNNRIRLTLIKIAIIMYRAISIFFLIKCILMENGVIQLAQRHSRYLFKIIIFIILIIIFLLKVVDPATNKVLGEVPDANLDDLNIAVNAASDAFKIWSAYTAEVTINYL